MIWVISTGSETDLYPTLTRQRSMTVDPAYGNSVMRTAQLIGEQSGEGSHHSKGEGEGGGGRGCYKLL